MSYKYLMQVAPRASSRGTSLANRDSLHPDQKNSSKVAELGVDGGGGGRSSEDDPEDDVNDEEMLTLALRFEKEEEDSLGRSFVLVLKQPSSLE